MLCAIIHTLLTFSFINLVVGRCVFMKNHCGVCAYVCRGTHTHMYMERERERERSPNVIICDDLIIM